jgi:hypothetical protein
VQWHIPAERFLVECPVSLIAECPVSLIVDDNVAVVFSRQRCAVE